MTRGLLIAGLLGLAAVLSACAVVETAGDLAVGTGQAVLGTADLLI